MDIIDYTYLSRLRNTYSLILTADSTTDCMCQCNHYVSMRTIKATGKNNYVASGEN